MNERDLSNEANAKNGNADHLPAAIAGNDSRFFLINRPSCRAIIRRGAATCHALDGLGEFVAEVGRSTLALECTFHG